MGSLLKTWQEGMGGDAVLKTRPFGQPLALPRLRPNIGLARLGVFESVRCAISLPYLYCTVNNKHKQNDNKMGI